MRHFVLLALFCASSLAKGEGYKRMIGTKPLPPMPAEAFTLCIIPDTQSYLGKDCKATTEITDPVTNPNLEAQLKWIREFRTDQNIVFVSHVGEILYKYNIEQWAVAKQHLDMTSKGNARSREAPVYA